MLTLLSERVLSDTILTLGIMICFYYGLTAFACVWYFRRELFASTFNIVFKLLFPLLGGLMLAAVFVISLIDSADPANGSGAEIGGVGLVFVLAVGLLAARRGADAGLPAPRPGVLPRRDAAPSTPRP